MSYRILDSEELKVALQIHERDRLDRSHGEYERKPHIIPKYRFRGYHICDETWNKAHLQAWVQGYHLDDPNDYIFWFMNQFHDPEIICDFHFKYLKRILDSRHAPDAPKSKKLTFTQYKYGILTLSGRTTNTMSAEDRLSDVEGMSYLQGLYDRYFSPQTAPKRDFICNAWIENVKSNNNLHMHVFYRRKKDYLKINTGFLQYSKKGLQRTKSGKAFDNSTFCKSDDHIRNEIKYIYDDGDSYVVKELCTEITYKELM